MRLCNESGVVVGALALRSTRGKLEEKRKVLEVFFTNIGWAWCCSVGEVKGGGDECGGKAEVEEEKVPVSVLERMRVEMEARLLDQREKYARDLAELITKMEEHLRASKVVVDFVWREMEHEVAKVNGNCGKKLEDMERMRDRELEEKRQRFCETDLGSGTSGVEPTQRVDQGAQMRKMRRERAWRVCGNVREAWIFGGMGYFNGYSCCYPCAWQGFLVHAEGSQQDISVRLPSLKSTAKCICLFPFGTGLCVCMMIKLWSRCPSFAA